MIESISEFYKRIGRTDFVDSESSKENPYFNIQPSKYQVGKESFNYSDFYKVVLIFEITIT